MRPGSDDRPWTEAVDGASLAVLRIALGGFLCGEALRYVAAGWVHDLFVEPGFHFTFTGFEWVRPLPGAWMVAVFVALALGAGALALGAWYRVSAWVVATTFAWVFLAEKARYLNHYYLTALLALLFALAPAVRALSIRELRGRAVGSVPRWLLALFRAQIGIVYLYAGIAKLNADWMLRAEPLREWLSRRADVPVLGPLYAREETAWLMSWSGCVLDLVAWPLLAWRRTRAWTFGALVLFHLLNAATFGIGIFPWLMIAATTLWFDPSWPRRLHPRLRRTSTPGEPARSLLGPRFAAVWIALQLLVPLRHFLYPGNVHWTEEGHAFAWHMKLRGKESRGTLFSLRDPETGRVTLFDPRNELASWQVRKMSTRPDMILQYAHHLARRAEATGPRPEVRVHAEVSLNSRPFQLLIDPEVDLAATRPSLGPAGWILPLEPPERPPERPPPPDGR